PQPPYKRRGDHKPIPTRSDWSANFNPISRNSESEPSGSLLVCKEKSGPEGPRSAERTSRIARRQSPDGQPDARKAGQLTRSAYLICIAGRDLGPRRLRGAQ